MSFKAMNINQTNMKFLQSDRNPSLICLILFPTVMQEYSCCYRKLQFSTIEEESYNSISLRKFSMFFTVNKYIFVEHFEMT